LLFTGGNGGARVMRRARSRGLAPARLAVAAGSRRRTARWRGRGTGTRTRWWPETRMCVSNWPRSRPTYMSSGSAESTSAWAARWSARGPTEAGPDFEVPRYLHPS